MEQFKDDDGGYVRWVQENPSGFVVNTSRNPSASYLVLHRATCHTITGTRTAGPRWTADYIKVCSLHRMELQVWAQQKVGGMLTPCPFCQP